MVNTSGITLGDGCRYPYCWSKIGKMISAHSVCSYNDVWPNGEHLWDNTGRRVSLPVLLK